MIFELDIVVGALSVRPRDIPGAGFSKTTSPFLPFLPFVKTHLNEHHAIEESHVNMCEKGNTNKPRTAPSGPYGTAFGQRPNRGDNQRSEGSPRMDLIRTYNLASVLAPGELLIDAMCDTDVNLCLPVVACDLRPSADMEILRKTLPPLDTSPTGPFHICHIPNEMVENGITITGTTVYVTTGPSGTKDHENATSTLYSLTSGLITSIKTLWSIPYDAGHVKKPGTFARSSGATPALLGGRYVAITDNANSWDSLVVYHQKAQNGSSQTICSVPLFESRLSNVDTAPLTHRDGNTYGVTLCNDFNALTLYYVDSGLDGKFNNLTPLGVIRVDIAADGSSCKVAWENDLRVQSVPLLYTRMA